MVNFGKIAKGGAKIEDPHQQEIERAKADDTQRRQQVLLRARLHELLQEEEAMARTSLKNIQVGWIAFLRQQKHKELTAEIEIVRHEFEKTLDRKNAVIAMHCTDLDEAEEQHRLALRTHLGNIDALVDLQNRRMADLDKQFEDDLATMKSDFELERTEIQRKHELEKADLKLIQENMKTEAENEDRKLQEETSESHDTAIEKMDEEKKQMQSELAKQTDLLRAMINAHFTDFNSTAELNMKEYTDLTRQDEKAAKDIDGQAKKIAKLQESINTTKSNLANNIRECEERNAAMKAEKETTAKHFKTLKVKMQLWRKRQELRLADLVTNARDTKQTLEKKSEHAERVLRLVELCVQLETEREKVLRFQADISSAEVQDDVAARVKRFVQEEAANNKDVMTLDQLAPEGSELTAAAAEEWKLMERFWLRYNKVVLDNAAIGQEKFHLENENAKLRALLKQYLDGISVNHDVMGQANNLLQATKIKPTSTLDGGRGRGAGSSNIPTIDGRKVILETVKQRVK